jgi:hypothetical protein
MTDATGERAHPVRRRQGRGAFTAVWAAALTVLLGLTFTGTTVVTIALWATDDGYLLTNPVVDMAFFALGGLMITVGVATQVRGARVVGLQQAVLALLAFSLAGAFGGRIEPFVGPLVLLVAITPLVVLHPRRRALFALGEGISGPLLAMALLAAVPAARYAASMFAAARAAGPSCFLGQCVQGDRLAEAGALALAVVLVAALAALRTPGWRLPAWCAGLAAGLLGAASWLFPAEQGALSVWLAIGAVVWGTAFIAVAETQVRRPRVRS